MNRTKELGPVLYRISARKQCEGHIAVSGVALHSILPWYFPFSFNGFIYYVEPFRKLQNVHCFGASRKNRINSNIGAACFPWF